jgi:uroporphyrinogen-III synthase
MPSSLPTLASSSRGCAGPAPDYFAIGRTTALALHKVSNRQVRYPLDREISEVLLQLPELQNIAGKKALILRGNGGRELLGDTLRERGAVTFCECYQRSARHYDGAEEAMRWQSRGVSTLVITSGEMLQQLWTLIPQWYRERWLLSCRIFVVSERLAEQAREWAGRISRLPIAPTTMRCYAHYNNSQHWKP